MAIKEDYVSYEFAKKLKECGITLYHGDCLDVLPTLADGSISACIADLPYGCFNKGNKHA